MNHSDLPVASTPFVGRSAELTTIRQWLADPTCRLLSLVGLGGVGKTRLAMEVTRQNADDFPDGVFFVRLQPLELPELILPTIAEAVHIAATPGVDLKRQIVGFLDGKRRLVVLDSLEHLLPGVDVIIELLQCAPDVKFLVTSREKLNILEEAVLPIGPLPYPEQGCGDNSAEQYDAVALLLTLLQRHEPGQTITPDMLAAACQICRQIQGLPLAIELAAGWADALSLAEIAQELGRSFDILTDRSRDGSVRRNIRTMLNSSLQTLPAAEREVLERLCVFRSSFTREAAQIVAGATVHSLALLVSKSLVRRLPSGRYEIHELLRQYGEEYLKQEPGQHEAAQERYVTYYADFLDAQWHEIKAAMHNAAFERIDAELINITIAFGAMIDRHAIAQIARSMNPLWAYCAIRSRFSEGALMFGRGVDVLRADPDNPLLASLLLRHAFFTACLGAYRAGDKAKRLADEGLALLRQQDEVAAETLILAYFCSGIVHWLAGDSQRMKDAAQLGLDYANEADHALGTRLNLCLLGRAEFKLGNYRRAGEIGRTGYELAVSADDVWVQGFIAFNVLGDVAFVEQEYEEAQRWCQIAQQCFENLHEPWTLATTVMLAVCAVALRDLAEAQRLLMICLRMLEERGLLWQLPAMALRVARLLAEQQMAEYAVVVLASTLQHPMCRDKTRGEATELLAQLESMMSPASYAIARATGHKLPLEQLIEIFPRLQPPTPEPRVEPGPLSDRELDVLRLIADGLSNAEIAQHLYLAIGTVKVHVKHIFDKLEVKSRTEAVKRARELGLLPL